MDFYVRSTDGALELLPAPEPLRSGWPWTSKIPKPTLWTKHNNINIQWPRISIVTPSLNQGQFIEATIRSVLLQNYPNLEYIVVDGCSVDGSQSILRKYKNFLTYSITEADHGQADAINKGFSYATGEIFGWLNSDDMLLPNALQHIGLAFMQRADTKVIYGFRKVVDTEGQLLRTGIFWLPDVAVLQREPLIPQETVYWRREVWDKLGPLNTDFHFAMDYEYWQRMLRSGYNFELLPYFLGAFRLHPDSKTVAQGDVRQRDLDIIHQQYLGKTIGPAEIDQDLGAEYEHIKQLVKELNHIFLFKSRYTAALILHTLAIPLLAKPVLLLHRWYRIFRK